MLVDGTQSNTATVAQGYASRIVQEFALEHARTRGIPLDGGVDLHSRAWFNPGLTSRAYNVPAVMGVLLLLMSLLLTALAVVRERELGTVEQLMTTAGMYECCSRPLCGSVTRCGERRSRRRADPSLPECACSAHEQSCWRAATRCRIRDRAVWDVSAQPSPR